MSGSEPARMPWEARDGGLGLRVRADNRPVLKLRVQAAPARQVARGSSA